MASTSQAPDTARKAPLYCTGCAVSSPTKQQTEGTWIMNLSNSLMLLLYL